MGFIRVGLIVFGLCAVGFACRGRSNATIEAAGTARYASEDLEKQLATLRQERADLLAMLQEQKVAEAMKLSELSKEREDLTTERMSLEGEVGRLRTELTTQSTNTEAEKMVIMKRLSDTEESLKGVRVKLDNNDNQMKERLRRIEKLSKDMEALAKRVETLEAEIERLNNLLAEERAKNEAAAKSARVSTQSNPTVIKGDEGTVTAGTGSTGGNTGSGGTPAPGAGGGAAPIEIDNLPKSVVNKAADGTLSCFEFGSTADNASLLGITCVDPVPVRQQFKFEKFDKGYLIIDARSSMCARIDKTNAARIALKPCLKDGVGDEVWTLADEQAASKSFKLKNVSSGTCLQIVQRRVGLVDCASGALFGVK